jgi:ribonuclease HI
MQTLSTNHPIQHWIKKAWLTRTAKTIHRSNLQNALHQFHKIISCDIETIQAFVRPPWWKLEVKVTIPESKETAKNAHEQITSEPDSSTPEISIYTDGSGIDGNIGAAAYSPEPTNTVCHHLGSDQQYNVYSSELTAFLLALQILKQQRRINNVEKCRIFSDSQAAIRALMNPRKQSGQAIIKDILDEIDRLLLYEVDFTINWIPGHEEIHGNEKADEAAKKAARDPTINRTSSWKYTHHPLKSAQKTRIKALAESNWREQWLENTKTANALRHLSKHPKFQSGKSYYGSAPTRKSASLLAQMRTGHCGLNLYLKRFKKTPSAYCKCQYQRETVQHFLLECREYKTQRDALRRTVGSGKMKMQILLGDPKYIKHIVNYVEDTKRFE